MQKTTDDAVAVFSDVGKAAMAERVKELKAEARLGAKRDIMSGAKAPLYRFSEQAVSSHASRSRLSSGPLPRPLRKL